MKVTSTTSPLVARDQAKSSGARRSSSTSPDDATGTAEATTTAATRTSVPPGLERVLGRLQSMSPDSMNRGQANALQHIEANIARYRENHGIAAPVPAPTDSTPTITATNATASPDSTTAPTAAPTTSSPTSVPAPSTDSTAGASSTQASTDATLIDSIPPAGSLVNTQA